MPSVRKPRAPAPGDAPDSPDSPEWGVSVGNPDLPGADDAEPEETAQDRIAFMLRDVRNLQAARVRLYRKNAQSRKLAWCSDYSPEEFEGGGFDMIRSQWGAGAYEIRIYGDSGGGFGLMGRSELDIVAALSSASAAPANSELAQVLARMSEQQATQNAAILAALQNKPDPMASMKDSLALMTMMREAMGMNNQATQKSSIGEIIDAIRELKGAQELIAPEKPEVDTDNPLSMLPQIIELVKMAQQKNQTPEIAFPVLQTPPSLGAIPAPDSTAPAIPESLEQPTDDAMRLSYIFELKKSFASLLSMAKMFAACAIDAEKIAIVSEAAEFVYENLPDEMIEVLQGDNWFAALQMVAPEISAHQEFFSRARDAALKIFADEARIVVKED